METPFDTAVLADYGATLVDYNVTSTADDGSPGTLRWAINQANASAGVPDTIIFNIAATDSGHWYYTDDGVGGQVSLGNITATTAATDAALVNPDADFAKSWYTIALTDGLPTISDAVIVDGTTQSGFSGTPIIELDGSGATGGVEENILTIEGGNTTIRGLVLNQFAGSYEDAIEIEFGGNNTIVGNYIGTDVSGTIARGNDWGVNVKSDNNQIGGTTGADRNIISGNVNSGLYLYNATSFDNVVSGNYIGVDANGLRALGNGDDAIFIDSSAHDNLIGGTASGAGNVIAHNNGDGVSVRNAAADGHQILGNSIYQNASQGIDLGADGITSNDGGDGDGGPNELQNYPMLDYALTDGNSHLTVKGSLDTDLFNQDYRIEFFATSIDEVNGEAERYLTALTVKTDGSGDASFSAVLPATVAVNEYVTATATVDNGGGNFGNTSEFAVNVQALAISGVLWTSTDADVGSPGADGLTDGWRQGEVLQFGGPSLNLGAATDGDFSSAIDFDRFTTNASDVGALHFVSQGLSVGSGANTFDLQVGDVLVSFNQDEDILDTYYETGVQTTVHMNDLLAFRPDTLGDYTSGTFYMLLNGVPNPLGAPINSLHAISLVEQDTTVGGTLLTAGTFLFSEQSGVAPNTPNHIYHFAPTDAGQVAASGTSQILIDGDDIDIEVGKNIRGLELIERPTTVGALNLDEGDILVTLIEDDTSVGDSPALNTAVNDIFVLKVIQAEPEPGNLTAATAEMVLDGSLVNLDGSERPYAIALVPANFAPVDLQAMATSTGGLSLNEDGSNDAYFIADNGLSSPLSQLTFEMQFTANNTPSETVFVSYNTGSGDELAIQTLSSNNGLELNFGAGGYAESTAVDYYATLLDGQRHTLSVTWDNSAGDWAVYVDGAFVDGDTGLNALATIQSGGALIFGLEQDAVGGGFDSDQYFSGTIYDARLFDALRSPNEITANYARTLPYDESGLIANWTFNDLSTDGVVTDTVSGNNLTVQHVGAGGGFTTSNPALTFELDENAVTGAVVGSVVGTDAEREAQIAALLAADPELHYNAETGKFYKVVIGWFEPSEARTNAESTTLNTVNGQLATIRSAGENEFVRSISASVPTSVWLGGTDATVEGEWRWIESGAEADQFWSGAATGDAVNGAYQNWASASQPNDLGDEDHMRMNTTTGEWWDDKAPQVHSYVVEWDADEVLDATNPLTYSIQTQTVLGAFAIDTNTGLITVADGALLDYETNATHTVTVRVSDGSKTYDEAFTVALTDLVDTASAPTDLAYGIELNTDDGNDAYLQAADGGALLAGLNAVTFETQVEIHSPSTNATPLISYAVVGESNEFKVEITPAGQLQVVINQGTNGVFTSTQDYSTLLDGDKHHVAVSWDANSGAVSVYIDGQLFDSVIGYATGYTIAGGGADGTLVFGNEQDSHGGGFQTEQALEATLYDVRLWDEVRSAEEIALNYQHKFDSGGLPGGLIANWQMDGFNGSNEVVDVVGANNLSIGHAAGPGFTASTPDAAPDVDENAANGTSVGYVVPTDPDVYNDVVNDGLFLEAADPGSFTTYGNGSTIGAWDVSGQAAVLAGTVWDSTPLGGRSVELAASDAAAISQSIATEAGRTYQVIFVESGDWSGDTTLAYRVSAAGQSRDFIAEEPSGWSYSNMLWNQRSMTFTADSSSATLRFESLETGSSAAVIGDVRVIEIPNAVSTILNNDPTLTYDAATGKFYQLVNTDETWANAQAAATGAQLNGVSGQLLTIGSKYENEFARELADTVGQDVWLGASDQGAEGDWRWYEGNTEGEQFWLGAAGGTAQNGLYNNWDSVEPNDTGGNEDFAYLDANGEWNDWTAVGQQNYIIEWDASEVLSNFTFTVTDDAGGRFAIDSSSGEITVANGSLLELRSQARRTT